MRHAVMVAVAAAVTVVLMAGFGGVAVAEPLGWITGNVQSDDETPIRGAHVLVYNWDTGLLAGEAITSGNGTYSVGGLVLAKYRVKAEATGYLPEDYQEGTARSVTVVPPLSADDIDFTLTRGYTIYGCVRMADTLTPIEGARVVVHHEVGGVWEYAADGYADSYGFYGVTLGTGEGTYRVEAQAAGYATQYYSSVSDPGLASDITVSAGGETDGVNFALTRSGFISGTVYEGDGLTPVATARVAAYDNATGQCAGEGYSEARDGSYYINLKPGAYRLKAEDDGYVVEWYADVTEYGAATPVSVAGLYEKPGVDFTLDTGTRVSTFPAVVAASSVRLTGRLTSLGMAGDATVSFMWGTSPDSCNHETAGTVRESTGFFTFELRDLTEGAVYYFRAKAVGDGDPVYGDVMRLKTIDSTSPVISGGVRCVVTASVATITWATTEPATSQIDYGLTPDYDSSTGEDKNMVTDFSVCLVDLRPDTTYHYRIIARDGSGNKWVSRDLTFTTEVYYRGMATETWKIVGYAVVVATGVVLCLVWAKAR